MKHKFLYLIACFLWISGTTFAQLPEEKHQAMKAARKEAREYVKTQVFPVIKAQRAKLETQISDEDKGKIADLRQQIKGIRGESKMWQGRHHPRGEKREFSEAEKAQMQEKAKKMRRTMLQAWVIADSYEEAIKALREEIKPQSEKWKADLKAILEKNMPAKMQDQENAEKCEKRKGHGRMGKHLGHFQKSLSPVSFLLLDPNAPAPETDEEDEEISPKTPTTIVFPNPSQAENVVRLTTTQAGKITIRLLDKDSQVLKTVFDENRAAGEQNLAIKIGDLKKGIYYYQIITPTSREVKRFLKE